MAIFMNEYEVEEATRIFDADEVPNLAVGARILSNLVQWVNSCSDGWPYWRAPKQAANRLVTLLNDRTYAARFGHYQGTARPLEDATKAELTKALTPIKSFLTKSEYASVEDYDAILFPWNLS